MLIEKHTCMLVEFGKVNRRLRIASKDVDFF